MSDVEKTRASGRGRAVQPLQVYDGQLLIGELRDYGPGNVDAFRLDRKRRVRVGTYSTRLEAMRAISKLSIAAPG
jgi:hypothetical protein